MSEDFNLFEAEDRLVASARSQIAAGVFADAEQETMVALLAGYERLLRETKQLIRLSDRREKELNRLNRELEQLSRSLAYLAEHDTLTGCLNKGAIQQRIATALETGDAALLLLDIDHFKRINDTYGHPAGDEVLKHLVVCLRAQFSGDSIGRMGGEEFVILLREPTTLIQMRVDAESMRRRIEATLVDTGTTKIGITVSTGITLGLCGEDFAAVYARADQALYAAKEGGRNCVAERVAEHAFDAGQQGLDRAYEQQNTQANGK